jgi:hypothetical protein
MREDKLEPTDAPIHGFIAQKTVQGVTVPISKRSDMRTLLILTLLRLPVGAADMSVKQYEKEVHSSDRNRADAIKLYVIGIGQGIAWANTAAEKNNSPLYCQPRTFSMNGTNYIDILDKMIKTFESKTTVEELNELPVAMLLVGLQETFPCQTAK